MALLRPSTSVRARLLLGPLLAAGLVVGGAVVPTATPGPFTPGAAAAAVSAVEAAVEAAPTNFALNFLGGTSDGRVAFASPLTGVTTRSMTLEADVRWDGTAGVKGIVSQPRSDSATGSRRQGFALLLDDGAPCIAVHSGGEEGQVRQTCSAVALTPGVWSHVSVAHEGSQDTVTVDGVDTSPPSAGRSAGVEDDNDEDQAGRPPLVIGRLFASEVAAGLPAAQLTGFGGDLDNVRVANGTTEATTTVALWTFDEGDGDVVAGTGSAPLTGTRAGVPAPQWVLHDDVVDPQNTTWPTALAISDGSGISGRLQRDGEARWYRFPVQPDQKVRVDVTALPADYDITMFKDISQAFTTLVTPSDLDTLSAEFAGDAFAPSVFSPSVFSPSVFSPSVFSPSVFSPSVFSPSVFSPSVFSPSVFSPSVFSPSVFSPSVFSPSVFSPSVFSPSVFSPSVFSPSVFSPDVFAQAYSSAQTRSLIAVSARDGLADESVASSTWDNTGSFYVRVVGRGGVSARGSYQIRLTTTSGACTTVLDPKLSLPTVTGTPGSATTVILTDSARMKGTPAAVATLATRTSALAAATGGVVVDLATVPRVQALNAQADADRACPYAKNLVAQAARDIVTSYRSPAGVPDALRYVVLLGGDDVLPFFRYADAAGLGPENGYVPPVADDTASQASLRRNTFLSQDAYGARVDVSLKGGRIPVPDVAVGRLVETAGEISAQIDSYLALPGGSLPTASSSLVTGYDFLTDAADDVAATLAAGIPGAGARNETLITDQGVSPATRTGPGGPSRSTSWTATDLKTKLLGARHDITYLAGHFSANSALAADFSTSVLTTDLATAPAGTFANTLVISAGCHSGYNLLDADGVPGLTLGLDWAQAFAQQGATLVAGTGYQYGDTDFLEYSERLYAGLASQLRLGTGPVAIGTALLNAKQEYLSTTPSIRGIHTKALLESTLFGLPMLGIDLPGRVPAPADASVVTPTPVTTGPGSVLGLQQATLAATVPTTVTTRTLTTTDVPPASVSATYLSGPDGVVTNPGEPALPLDTRNVTVRGSSLRGIGWRSGTYTDTTGVTPLTGAPATETNGVHAPFATAAFYPPRLASANYFDAVADPGNGATRLSLTPAQYRSDAPGSATATQRRYTAVGLELFYSNNIRSYPTGTGTVSNVPALAAPPAISAVSADPVAAGNPVPVRARVSGDPAAGIQKVWVTYTGVAGSPLFGAWASVDLTQDPRDSTLWTGTIPAAAGQASGDVRYLVQAVNGVGLVSADDDGGAYYVPGGRTSATAAGSTLTLGAVPATGSYGSSLPVSATLVSGTSPVPGRVVTFTLGASSVVAVTDAAGVATASLPLLDLPGSTSLVASFDGDAAFGPSASQASPVTVTKQPTALALSGAPASVIQGTGQSTGVVAVLTASADGSASPSSALPVRNRSVYFAVTDAAGTVVAGASRITDLDGRAALGALSTALPVGSYTVTASFAADSVTLPGGTTSSFTDPVYAPSSASGALVVTPATPGAPTAVSATAGERSALVSWTAPAYSGGSPITRYTVTATAAGSSALVFSTVDGTPPATQTTVTGLVPSTAYTFTVVATNAAGDSAPSAPSAPVTPFVVARTVSVVSGSGQSAVAGQPFGQPLVAKVVDSTGSPVPGVSVTFTVSAVGTATPGSASFTGSGAPAQTATAVTDAAGLATSPVLTAGTATGALTVTARTGTATAATFTLTVTPVPPARADLQVGVTAPATIARGGTLTATVTVKNLGPSAATKVVTAITPTAGLSVVSAPGATLVAGVPTYTAPTLAVGASVTYTVTLKATATKATTSTVAAATISGVTDPKLTNNAAASSVKIT